MMNAYCRGLQIEKAGSVFSLASQDGEWGLHMAKGRSVCYETKSIRFRVNQNMFDALTSFVYNCGPANLKTLVNQRDAKTVGKKILLYDKCNGKVLEGLSRRRKEESKLFLSE